MINRTAMPNSILYWANVAVRATDEYQILFPPSVQVGTHHAKNDFVHWPIGQGKYRDIDYTGKDLSWWKNHPRAVSCFAWDLQEDFMGGYDHGREAGMVHIGDHHVVCGAKLWEWAPNNIWDTKVLTDSDGPYAELMVGAFSDNQPDYSWIKPFEVKQFKQYWYPVRQIGGFKNANLDAVVNLQLEADGTAKFGFNTTSPQKKARAVLTAGTKTLSDEVIDISPEKPYVKNVKVESGIAETDLKARLLDAKGRELVAYQPVKREPPKTLPETVKAPPAPEKIATIEELYLTGLRLEQIYQPSSDPMLYYQEALKRDPDDVRTNIMVAKNYSRRQMYDKAEEHLRRAVKRMTIDYTRAIDTECFYQLGLVLKAQQRWDEAYDALYRATWDAAFHAPAYFELAELSARKGDWALANEHISNSLDMNAKNTRALNLKIAILRHMGRFDEAEKLVAQVQSIDPLDSWSANESVLLLQRKGQKSAAATAEKKLTAQMRDDVQAYLEMATDYMAPGMLDDAIELLSRIEKSKQSHAGQYPLVSYYLGYLYQQQGDKEKAKAYFAAGSQKSPNYCFPFRRESAEALNAALAEFPNDGRAYYYLGNLYYDLQPEKAVALWEKSCEVDPSLGILHRNLGWVYSKQEKIEDAIKSYEKAIECNKEDPRYYLELDDLYAQANADPAQRFAMLEKNPGVMQQRKFLLIRQIYLLVRNQQYDRAIDQLTKSMFFVSEGGGDELGNAYVDAYLLRGLASLAAGQAPKALKDFEAAGKYPDNLSQESPRNEGKQAQVLYFTAQACKAAGDKERAQQALLAATDAALATRGDLSRYYQALAFQELGQAEKADPILKELADAAARQIEGQKDVDFFAKFGGQQSQRVTQANAFFMKGLVHLARGEKDQAKAAFDSALKLDKSHVWAKYYSLN
jgi:tetratricopeptide (TPR) repeat protein